MRFILVILLAGGCANVVDGTDEAPSRGTSSSAQPSIDGASSSCPAVYDGTEDLRAPLVPLVDAGADRTLLFSDSPESPTRSGILFEGHASGRARVFVYHVNATSIAKKVSVVVDNEGDSPLSMNLERYAVAHGRAYLDVGDEVATGLLTASNATAKSIPAHGRGLLLAQHLDGVSVPPGALIHAVVDVTLSGPARVRVVMLDATTDTLAHVDDVAPFARDAHDRGTFAHADRDLSSPCALARTMRVRLGDATLAGVDELTGAPSSLHGEYGVVTRISLAPSSPYRAVLSPRAGAFEGPVVVGGRAVDVSTTRAAVALGSLDGDVVFTAPGGSNLPVDLLLLPR